MNELHRHPDSPAALAILESSVVIRLVGRTLIATRQASADSVLLALPRSACAELRGQPGAIRRRALGVMLLAAAGTHAGLATWKQDPPGWIGMILPVLAAVIGAVFVSAGTSDPRGRG